MCRRRREGQLGEASRAGGQAGGECIAGSLAHTDPVRSAQCRAHCIGILGAVGFKPTLHPDAPAQDSDPVRSLLGIRDWVTPLGFPDFY